MGKLLAYLGMSAGHEVTYMPSYGAEVRGGTANCTVILSDRKIASPVSRNPTTVIAMNKPSQIKFEPRMSASGLLILNSSLIDGGPSRDDVRCVEVPANAIAEELGSVRVANMVALGLYLAARKILALELALDCLSKVLPARRHDLLEINLQALRRGAKEGS